MNSNLISRTLLRNEFVKYIDVFGLTAWNKINDIIDNAPAVDISGNEYFPYRTAYFNGVEDARAIARLQGEWIPVRERLPEERINPNTNDFEDVLCSTIWDDVRPYKYGKPIGHDKAHFWHGGGIMDEAVIAWRYIPEPYKKGGSNG